VAFTDNCDLFGAIHEDGINLVARHVMRKRPSLFNYGTAPIVASPELWCTTVDVDPDVLNFSDPVMTEVQPLPLPGTSFGVNIQIELLEPDDGPIAKRRSRR